MTSVMNLNEVKKIYTFKVNDIVFKCIPTLKYYKYLETINMMNIKQVRPSWCGSVIEC